MGRSGSQAAGDRHQRGFGLLELMVAIAIAGMAVSAAAVLLVSLGDRISAVRVSAERADRDANAERLLTALVRNLDAGSDRDRLLEGEPDEVRFSSWCDGPRGRPEPCQVHLLVVETAIGHDVEVRLTGHHAPDSLAFLLWRGARSAKIIYLVDAGNGGTWAEQWVITPFPLGLGLVLDADTLVLPAGTGG